MTVNSGDSNEMSVPAGQKLQGAQIAPRGKTLWNAIVRFGAQFISMLANLLATPYIIRKLGVESYGVISVINTMISYMAIKIE